MTPSKIYFLYGTHGLQLSVSGVSLCCGLLPLPTTVNMNRKEVTKGKGKIWMNNPLSKINQMQFMYQTSSSSSAIPKRFTKYDQGNVENFSIYLEILCKVHALCSPTKQWWIESPVQSKKVRNARKRIKEGILTNLFEINNKRRNSSNIITLTFRKFKGGNGLQHTSKAAFKSLLLW